MKRLQTREAMLRKEFGDAWVDSGYELPGRASVVTSSLLFPGLGHRSLHDDRGATNFFIAGLAAWIVCLALTSWFMLFGVLFLALPFVHIYAARDAGARWDMLQGYPSRESDGSVTAHTVTYGPDGPIASETRIDGVPRPRS